MSGRSWLRNSAVLAVGLVIGITVLAPAAWSKKKATPTPTPTPTPSPTPAPTPEAKIWNFDSDKAGAVAQGWNAVEGDWQVMPDATAPTPPNVFGLPAGRVMKSLMNGLAYTTITVLKDPTEYDNFTLEAQFKAKKGYFDCTGGLVFRYVGPKDYYVYSAQCPNDFSVLTRVSGGQEEVLKQTVTPIDEGTWYALKVVADGEHMTCYLNNKMAFDVTDKKIAKGRIGLFARDDSEPHFDNFTLTLPMAGAAPAGGAAPEAAPATGGEAPPAMPSEPAPVGGGAPPALPPALPK